MPGLGLRLDSTKLDLQYHTTYAAKELPDAYERLLLDVVNGASALGGFGRGLGEDGREALLSPLPFVFFWVVFVFGRAESANSL